MSESKRYLDLAARVALRGLGNVEPNPMVGAVIVKDHQVIGVGHHTRFGDLHAEREAIKNARSNGFDSKGATLYCTLEPCSHQGKQPPCTQAVIEAGIRRVVVAQLDPAPVSSGGRTILESNGIEFEHSNASLNAIRLSEPFIHRVRTSTPWVIGKWAQTIDGKIATSSGESQWISNDRSRARVHKLRSVVDAVLIGSGTVIADNPQLTARVPSDPRRVAKRVILDTNGSIPLESKIVGRAHEIPTIVFTQNPEYFKDTQCIPVNAQVVNNRIDLDFVLKSLYEQFGVASLLVEAGPRVLGSFVQSDLFNEAIVYIAPSVMGDENARPVAQGVQLDHLSSMTRMDLIRSKHLENDIELHYRKAP